MIAESPALLAREQQAFTRGAAGLAALLAAETGAPEDDLRPQVVANALLGLQRAMVDYVRRRVSSGEDLGGLAADVRTLTAEAFALLSTAWPVTTSERDAEQHHRLALVGRHHLRRERPAHDGGPCSGPMCACASSQPSPARTATSVTRNRPELSLPCQLVSCASTPIPTAAVP